MTSNVQNHNENCYVCDNYIFKSPITVETTNGKIKLCCQLCFEKYSLVVEQMAFRARRVKAEKKAKE